MSIARHPVIMFGTKPAASGYDTATQAVFTYGDAEGYTALSTGSKDALDAFIVTLKTNSLWTKFDRLFIHALDNANYGLVNILNPDDTTNATNVNSCAHVAGEGFTGNGTTSYIDTNFNPSTAGTNYVLNDAGRGAYLFAAAGGTAQIDGVTNASTNSMIPSSNIGQRINQGTSNMAASIGGTGTGLHAIYRYNSTNVSRFVATTETSSTATSTSVINENQFILRSGSSYRTHTVGVYYMSSSFNSTQHGIINTAIATLIAAL